MSVTAIVYYFANHLVPNANVSVTALDDNPTVGESFSMECNVTIAKSIIGNVDIIWTVNDTIKRRVNDSVGEMNSEYILHRDVYNIEVLQLSDDNTMYVCEAMVNRSIFLKGNDDITIMLTNRKFNCDLLCENHPFRHICYFKKYHFETLKPLQFSCAVF